MKLIKLQDHYYILSDDEIKEGDYYFSVIHNNIFQSIHNEQHFENEFKITHSTVPLEVDSTGTCFLNIKPLNKFEIEELTQGYSIEKMAEYHWRMQYIMALDESIKPYIIEDYKSGFKAAMELMKDKLFTIEDMRKMYDISCGKISLDLIPDQSENNQRFNTFIQPLLPKTEWSCGIDSNGKIKLI